MIKTPNPEQIACQLLLSSGQNCLPIRPEKILQAKEIPMVSFTEFEKAVGKKNRITRHSSEGLTLFFGGVYTVLYDHTLSPSRRSWVLAHELGHILLGHLEPDCPPQHPAASELQADLFARHLLCPLEILHLCHTKTHHQLALLTGMEEASAKLCFDALTLKRQKDQLFLLPESKILAAEFLPFISNRLNDFSKTG